MKRGELRERLTNTSRASRPTRPSSSSGSAGPSAKAAPGATEGFDYDMPVFRFGDRHIFYVGAWKKHVGLYPDPSAGARPRSRPSPPLRSGKDTVKLRLFQA